MSLITHKLAAATAVAAAFSMAATPVGAVELPRVAGQQVAKAGSLDVENRRHRGHHGHGGWDDDIDAGDVLAGVLILGGIAAIASAAGKNRERSYPEPEPYPEDAGYQAPPPYRAGGMSAAVDTCVAEVEAQRGAVGSVDRASRSGEGWYVAGELRSGAGYSCWVDQDGRVTDIEADDYGASYDAPADDPQEARASTAFVSKQRVPEAADDAGYELAQAEVAAN